MSDVDVVVVRHSAHVHADLAGTQGFECLFLSGERIMILSMGFEAAARGLR